MPPKKRKAIAADSDTDSDNVPSPPAKGKARRNKSSTAPPSKKRASTLNTTESEISGYVAKLVTSEYTVVQRSPCQSHKPFVADRCISCIEKQSVLGGCRFVNMRAFRKNSKGKVDYTDYAFRSNTDMPIITKKAPVKSAPKRRKKAAPMPVVPGTRRSTRLRTSTEGLESVTSPDGELALAAPVTALDDLAEDKAEDTISTLGETEIRNSSTVSPDLDEPDETIVDLVVRPLLTPEELKAEADYILPLIAPAFAEQLRREKHHEFTHLRLPTEGKALPGGARPLIRILSAPETRSLCDNCATSIYMGGYLCCCCGRELCLGCWEEWKPSAIQQGIRRRRIDTCSRRRRHIRDNMVFMTRSIEGEIEKLLERVEARIPSTEKQVQETNDANTGIESIPTCQPTWPNKKLKYLTTPKTHHAAITLQQFRSLWRRGGVPLVLTGFLDRFKLSWDPQYFIRHHGSESCYIHDCDTGAIMETTVKGFFTDFANPDSTSSYKLKDWPPSADFSTTFPKLFNDFENALPFPSYTSRNGALNLAAHFPEGYNAPDLGPKMYNAYPAPDFLPSPPEVKGSKPRAVKGTTNLHLDLTDAMNIMLFSAGGTGAPASATEPKDIPFCGAIWDIFPPSASVHLRSYLNSETYLAAHKHEGAVEQDDPIHRQLYYLTEADLATLYKDHKVMSYRIYQEPGEAVFIPAGCAHQVRNRKSCVKVAVDFLTPENVKVCKGLIEEGRSMGDAFQGRSGQGKEDVLQLWACLGFAWAEFDKQSEGDGSVIDLTGSEGDGVEVVIETKGNRAVEEDEGETLMLEVGKDAFEGKSDISTNGRLTRTEIEVEPLTEKETLELESGA